MKLNVGPVVRKYFKMKRIKHFCVLKHDHTFLSFCVTVLVWTCEFPAAATSLFIWTLVWRKESSSETPSCLSAGAPRRRTWPASPSPQDGTSRYSHTSVSDVVFNYHINIPEYFYFMNPAQRPLNQMFTVLRGRLHLETRMWKQTQTLSWRRSSSVSVSPTGCCDHKEADISLLMRKTSACQLTTENNQA